MALDLSVMNWGVQLLIWDAAFQLTNIWSIIIGISKGYYQSIWNLQLFPLISGLNIFVVKDTMLYLDISRYLAQICG